MPFYMLYMNLTISSGRSDVYMWCTAGQTIVQFVIVLLLYSEGITTVVWAYTVLTILWLFVWHWAGHRLVGLRLADMLLDTMPFFVIALAVMGVTYALTTGIGNRPLLLAVRIVMAATLYVGAMKLLKVKTLDDCLAFMHKSQKHSK